MGGCRCTYKNCTQRTDGSTHMFHYPVFDKVRCHQWLTNAQKLEFLNLKVSQLKNRVVCQHHFKKDNFMNFLNDKLTFDAVPTEDGPFCDSSQFTVKQPLQDDPKLYSISLEDIENDEYLTFNDKKANFSVKYGDFLTNCDLMDLDSMNLTDNTQLRLKGKHLEASNDIVLNDNINRKQIVDQRLLNYNTLDAVDSKNNVYTIHVSEVPLEIDGTNSTVTIPNINICHVPSTTPVPEQRNNNIIHKTQKSKDQHNKTQDISLKENRKIIIIDEQQISEPMPVTFPVKLEPVCPSAILPLPNKKKKVNPNQGNTNVNSNYSNNLVVPNVIDNNEITLQSVIIEEESNVNKAKSPSRQYNTRNKVQVYNTNNDTVAKVVKSPGKKIVSHNINRVKDVSNNINTKKALSNNINIEEAVSNSVNSEKTTSNDNSTINVKNNNSLLKNKITPERMAAIEEKRKFNMKLRDIIASCLDKLDDEESKDSTQSPSKIDRNTSQKVHSYLSRHADLPDYSVAYLEARMKRMENILINKIDQNTQKISEMQQLLGPKPDKKAAHTQTILNEESQKKHLYQEISKYLSPEANSLLYEELFINKHVQKVPKCSPTKRRKLR